MEKSGGRGCTNIASGTRPSSRVKPPQKYWGLELGKKCRSPPGRRTDRGFVPVNTRGEFEGGMSQLMGFLLVYVSPYVVRSVLPQ